VLKRGDTIDKYQIVDLLGRGGMALVYKVRHTQLGSLHALKLLFNTSPDVCRRLINEGRAQASLRHPHLVAVTDVIDVDGVPALLMEYVDGPPLDLWLPKNALTPPDALALFRGIVRGMGHAHYRGVVHRDLKPANILLAVTGEGLVPKVTDFGLVKAVGVEEGATRTGMALGTPNYMAPEQIADASSVDQRADVFALGCILYEIVAGGRVFEGSNSFDVYKLITAGEWDRLDKIEWIPDNVAAAVEACLKVDPDERLSSCQALFDMLYQRDDLEILKARDFRARDDEAITLGESADFFDKADEATPTLLAGKFDAVERTSRALHVEKEWADLPTDSDDESRPAWVFPVGVIALLLLGVIGFAGGRALQGESVVLPVPAPVVSVGPKPAVPIPSPPPKPAPVVAEPVQNPAPPPRPVEPVAVAAPEPEPAVPEPAPVTEDPELPDTATISVHQDSDATEIWLDRDGQRVAIGEVSPGQYKIFADYSGKVVESHPVTVARGDTVVVKCMAFAKRCVVKSL